MFAAGRFCRRRDQAKISSRIVGADKPKTVPMVEGIFMLVLPRADDLELTHWRICGKNARLAGDVAGRLHHQIAAIAGSPHAQVEALVVFFIDQFCFGGLPHAVPPELVLALLLFILNRVEKGLVVSRPRNRSHALDFFG